MKEALDIHVSGIVQGVGFRPFVYRLAKKYLIDGWVLNAADGVTIHAEGESKLLDEFVMDLSDHAPAAAQVKEIELKEVPLEGFDSFEIRFSDETEVEKPTLVSPDLATCDDCLAELFNPNDRRYRYPFINCTNCGPRFTITDSLPYDRPHTSMKAFPMCQRCAAEYADPADRRFHAQPDACFDCGPAVSLLAVDGGGSEDAGPGSLGDGSPSTHGASAGLGAAGDDSAGEGARPRWAWGRGREESDAIFHEVAMRLLQGQIVAVKGLGGFHLACDGNNPAAVAELRRRKRREGKPFAVMVASADDAERLCLVDEAERAVLQLPARPIVLLRKRPEVTLAPLLADALPELGVMLPTTPVQHLLIHDFGEAWAQRQEERAAAGTVDKGAACNPPMLVMTSGNLHDEPIVIDDGEAYERLSAVADAIMGNDRPILTRFDDSVVRVIRTGRDEEAIQVIRRARGFAPQPIAVPAIEAASSSERNIFATGPEQKNTFTLLRGAEAFVSQHVGDMENADVYDAWLMAKERFEGLFRGSPSVVACDLHPEYLTSKWAADQEVPVVRVQHHHAHIVSVMAEHGLTDAVCGVAFDGTGYGPDGAIWGGEVLLSNMAAFERFANFAYVPMPGGAAAIKHPLRMAYGALWAFDLLEHPAAQPALEALGDQAQICDAMIDQGINVPMTSSVGRLFDAASALLGLCSQPAYEGEGAILLEAALQGNAQSAFGLKGGHRHVVEAADDLPAAERYAVAATKNVATATSTAEDTSVLLLDAAPTFRALLDDVAAGVDVAAISYRFHQAMADAVVMAAELVRAMYGIATVVLSGGVFMNRFLVESVLEKLAAAGFTAAINRDLPPNDGCISLGQAVVAWARTETSAAQDN